MQKIDDDSIWNSYKKVVPYALKEVIPESLKPETMQMLSRLQARLILEIQEERKEPPRQVSIADNELREELDNLKSLVYEMKA